MQWVCLGNCSLNSALRLVRESLIVSKGVQSLEEKVCNVVTRVQTAGVPNTKSSGTLKLGIQP